VFVVPSAGFRATAYSLDETTVEDTSPTRTAPVATLDAGLVFERSGRKRVQTLEPRLLYTYIPYREQSGIPLFDTGLPDLNLVQLFRPERYVGGDRLGDANQVALGATTRLVELASGRQLVEATLGQIYYFERPRVQLPGEVEQRYSSSDLIAQLTVSAYKNWNVQLGQQWDTHENRSIRSEIRVQYAPGGDRVANLGYRFRRGLLEQVDGSVNWPVADAWSLFARQVYSLRDKKSIESLAGLQYQACCWRLRVVGRRYVSDRTGRQDTGITLQLELNGLSNVTETSGAFLERSVRGYSPAAGGSGR
jgi:LPS-assembly protein